jgi:putative transposase
MPRRARLACAGIPWHIIQRGNNRSACFYTEDDYLVYLNQLRLQADRFGCAIHAYCLMSNHVHLLLTPEHASSPSLVMKHLGQYYVQYINRTYERTGTLWEGRFKSCLAQDDRYVLTCYGYIELNPVRAHIASSPEDYQWSSFRCNALGESNIMITPHPDYIGLGASSGERCHTYSNLVLSRIDEGSVRQIRQATQGNFVLGDNGFQEEMALALGRRVKRGKAGRPRLSK